jgi:DNA-binding protein HU-beta
MLQTLGRKHFVGSQMLKKEFIERTSYVSGQTQGIVRSVLDAATAVTKKAISKGDSVMLFGLGKIHAVQRGEKQARNIRTGEAVIVPPRKAVLLQPSDSLIEAANSKQ